jgi:hypothetical protein
VCLGKQRADTSIVIFLHGSCFVGRSGKYDAECVKVGLAEAATSRIAASSTRRSTACVPRAIALRTLSHVQARSSSLTSAERASPRRENLVTRPRPGVGSLAVQERMSRGEHDVGPRQGHRAAPREARHPEVARFRWLMGTGPSPRCGVSADKMPLRARRCRWHMLRFANTLSVWQVSQFEALADTPRSREDAHSSVCRLKPTKDEILTLSLSGIFTLRKRLVAISAVPPRPVADCEPQRVAVLLPGGLVLALP